MFRVLGADPGLYFGGLRALNVDATTPTELCPAGQLLLPITTNLVMDAAKTIPPPTTEWTWMGAKLRVSTEMVALQPVRDEPDERQAGGGAEDNAETLERVARQIAAIAPAGDVARPDVPELGTDQVENARLLFNLTFAQLAELLGVTERQMYRYAGGQLPADRRETLDALVATGLLLAGSLGADGRRAWLESGSPSSIQLLREGRPSEVRSRAEDLRDSIAS
jgi:hypothetical protein